MRLLHALRARWSALLNRSAMSAEVEEELRDHLMSRADDLERSGMPRTEAERQARVEFGGFEHYRRRGYFAGKQRNGDWARPDLLWRLDYNRL